MNKPIQLSYLLRLWRDHADAPTRATLIAVERQNKPRHFASMDELFAFLSMQAYPIVGFGCGRLPPHPRSTETASGRAAPFLTYHYEPPTRGGDCYAPFAM